MSKSIFIIVLKVFLLSSVFGREVPNEDVVKKDLDALQGAWEVVSAEHAGVDGTKEFQPDPKFIFHGDAWIQAIDNQRFFYDASNSHIKLDPLQSPKTFDHIVNRTGGGLAVKIVYPGIYEIDGDTLKLCYDVALKSRPTEFKTKPGSTCALLILKRVKEEKK